MLKVTKSSSVTGKWAKHVGLGTKRSTSIPGAGVPRVVVAGEGGPREGLPYGVDGDARGNFEFNP